MVKKRLCEIVSTLLLSSSSVFFSSCSTPAKVDFEVYKQKLPDCAILVSAPGEWYEYLRVPFEFIYENAVASALKENLGIKGYTITFNAQEEDLEQVLIDENIQTIVVCGHGKWYSWHASNGDVTEREIAKFMKDNNIKKKHGFFIRHTCGSGRYEFNAQLISDREKSYLIKLLESYGAKNVVLDVLMNDYDKDFGKKRNRIHYSTSPNADKACLDHVVNSWNERFYEEVKSHEQSALGTSVVEGSSKTIGYEGVVGPLDYIFNPFSNAQTSSDVYLTANKLVRFINKPLFNKFYGKNQNSND